MKEKFLSIGEFRLFTKQCLLSNMTEDEKERRKIFEEHWTIAKDVEEFRKLVRNDRRLCESQAYWQLIKENEDDFKYMRYAYLTQAANWQFETYSDAGSLKIGTDEFTYNISNLYGDENSTVFIINNLESRASFVVDNLMPYLTSVQGKFNIYRYDCGSEVMHRLDGRYSIYRDKLMFVFVKIG